MRSAPLSSLLARRAVPAEGRLLVLPSLRRKKVTGRFVGGTGMRTEPSTHTVAGVSDACQVSSCRPRLTCRMRFSGPARRGQGCWVPRRRPPPRCARPSARCCSGAAAGVQGPRPPTPPGQWSSWASLPSPHALHPAGGTHRPTNTENNQVPPLGQIQQKVYAGACRYCPAALSRRPDISPRTCRPADRCHPTHPRTHHHAHAHLVAVLLQHLVKVRVEVGLPELVLEPSDVLGEERPCAAASRQRHHRQRHHKQRHHKQRQHKQGQQGRAQNS